MPRGDRNASHPPCRCCAAERRLPALPLHRAAAGSSLTLVEACEGYPGSACPSVALLKITPEQQLLPSLLFHLGPPRRLKLKFKLKLTCLTKVRAQVSAFQLELCKVACPFA